ncbi:MAG TPA: hypothetical protein VGO50_05145 [Pyrinomonadaceae bacterium]|jgi:hypothetical protein|nr:hypothetical protein [Pyrinomonadaceae bacterium]
MRKTHLASISSNKKWNDDDYELVFDDENGELYVEHSWHHIKYGGENRQGSENITLAKLREENPEIYQKVLDVITPLFSQDEE